MGAGAYIWEKTHKKTVEKEKELSGPIQVEIEPKKETTPAGELRTIQKEDRSLRRKTLDKQIEEAGG